MKATQLLHDLGQSLWLDNITRDLLDSGTPKHYVDDLSAGANVLVAGSSIFGAKIGVCAAMQRLRCAITYGAR